MDRRDLLGDFLASRRAKLRPEELGLPSVGRRRVPGLRRTEVAQLAGVSIDYYIRLEQGRAAHPSDEVLHAVARALQLDESEREHLLRLARVKPVRSPRRPDRVRPALRVLLEAMGTVPAFVLNRRLDVLAWNRLAAALFDDFDSMSAKQRNVARMNFLNPAAHDIYPDWEQCARESVANLRYAAGQQPDDQALAELVGELSVKSEHFRRWWAGHDVQEKAHGLKRVRHPLVGELTVAYETLALPADPHLALVVYTVEPGSPSETALRLLATLTDTSRTTATPANTDAISAHSPAISANTDAISASSARGLAGGG